MQTHSLRWVYLALIYFLVAVCLGVFMGASGDHRLMPVHAHLNLLGWVSLTLTAVIYHYFPQAGQSLAARLHFWLYNLALPLLMVALTGLMLGHPGIEPLVGIGSLGMLLAVVLFVGNVFRHRS